MIKRLFVPTFVFTLLAGCFSACISEFSTLPFEVSLNQSSGTLAPGETISLTATILPDEAAIKTVTWSSSNPDVATVTEGLVTAIAEGKAVITVTTKSGQKSAIFTLTVAWSVSGVTLDRDVDILTVGDSRKLTAIVSPDDAPDKTVIWVSSNPETVEVNDGTITAKSRGTATISAITEIGSKKATCTVRVVEDRHITITTVMPNGPVALMIAGSGTIYINWGDGSAVETFILASSQLTYSHYITGATTHVITVEGGSITGLSFPPCQMTNLDVSHISGLKKLDCTYNQLTSLDVSGCATLEDLKCSGNWLESLNLGNNNVLSSLDCSSNRLSILDLSRISALATLNCSRNQLSFLDVSNLSKLANFNCSSNPFIRLNVSNTRLKTLRLSDYMMLEQLIVSNNAVLTELNCSNNRLVSLDASNNNELTTLNCNNNRLSAEVLNGVFETLNNKKVKKMIYINNNPGTETCDRNIAVDKGWEFGK